MKYIIDTNNFPLSDYTKWVHDNATPLTDCTDAISRSAVEKLAYLEELDNGVSFMAINLEDVLLLPSVNPTTDLSKIRAEIEDYMMNFADSDSDNFIEFTAGLVLRQSCPYVLAIIDKYSKGGE